MTISQRSPTKDSLGDLLSLDGDRDCREVEVTRLKQIRLSFSAFGVRDVHE
ncbi:MAG: hypothetical protein IJV14_04695 [Lachnospiraceae bacterium]|nr:hypothetical protein [Lachnospiraceae bacterium]